MSCSGFKLVWTDEIDTESGVRRSSERANLSDLFEVTKVGSVYTKVYRCIYGINYFSIT